MREPQSLYPELAGLDKDQVAVLAGMGRSIVQDGEQDPFGDMSDPELASTMLSLQKRGLITLGSRDEEIFIQLNFDPAKAAREYADRRGKARPHKRYKRRSW